MSVAGKSPRARRGRLLVVGPSIETADENFIGARNIFDALGEITIAPATRPIATIVLTESGLAHDHGADHAIQAIRKVDPSLQIVLIATSPEKCADKGVDDCIVAPLTPDDLNRLFEADAFGGHVPSDNLVNLLCYLNGDGALKTEPRGKTGGMLQAVDFRQTRLVAGEDSPAMPMPTPMTVAPSNDPVPPARPSPEVPAGEATPAAQANTGAEPLGDTDLLDAIAAGPGLVGDVALRLVAQQTKWIDVALAGRDEAAADSRSKLKSAAVHFNGEHFGWLTSSLATAADLQLWADWLARWLHLDRKHNEYRVLSCQDDLTEAGNRRFFDRFLQAAIHRAAKARRPVTLMVFDIDNFKTFNDQFGHDAGDEILRETVRLMQTVIRQGDRVCRIGGDEFAVIFADDEAPREPGSKHPESIETIAKRFQDQICQMRFPKLGPEAPGTLTISAGLATYPWDGTEPDALLRHADQLALESKRKGKNLITFGQGAMRACRPEA